MVRIIALLGALTVSSLAFAYPVEYRYSNSDLSGMGPDTCDAMSLDNQKFKAAMDMGASLIEAQRVSTPNQTFDRQNFDLAMSHCLSETEAFALAVEFTGYMDQSNFCKFRRYQKRKALFEDMNSRECPPAKTNSQAY